MGKTSELHKLLNKERTKRGLAYARWNQELWYGCKSHSNYMLKIRHLVHASVAELPNGGECICGGKGNHSPETIVKSWMNSPGHKALILSPDIRSHAVAISDGKYGTYATWRGSNEAIRAQSKPIKLPNPFRILMGRGGNGMLRLPVNILLKCLSVLGIILGAHGFYVYLHRLDFSTVGAQKLFLVLSVPVRLEDIVLWMTGEGVHGWFIPILFVIAGMVLWSFSSQVGGQFTLLRKLHLW